MTRPRVGSRLDIVGLALLIAGLAIPAFAAPQSSASGAPPPSLQLVREGPIARWDEAMPLGNGLHGALVWGEGRTVRLSLDRGDLWDARSSLSWHPTAAAVSSCRCRLHPRSSTTRRSRGCRRTRTTTSR